MARKCGAVFAFHVSIPSFMLQYVREINQNNGKMIKKCIMALRMPLLYQRFAVIFACSRKHRSFDLPDKNKNFVYQDIHSLSQQILQMNILVKKNYCYDTKC